ncbi:MAG: prolyl oligopeptidase family serine peptidase [bacterium]
MPSLTMLALALSTLSPVTERSCTIHAVRTRALYAESGGATGRYASGDNVAYLATCGDSLAFVAARATSIEYLLPLTADSFAVAGRPHRTVVLERDGAARVLAIRVTGFGLGPRMTRATGAPSALELLIAGRVADAASASAGFGEDSIRALAATLFDRFPTRRATAARFLTLRHLSSASLGDRLFGALSARRVRDTLPLSFTLPELFAPPTAAELRDAARATARRSRVTDQVQVLLQRQLTQAADTFTQRVIRYTTAVGSQIASVVEPLHAARGCCATLLSIKGTNPSFSPLDLSRGTAILPLLGTAASAYVVIEPAIRGERIIVDGIGYASEGDRVDGWDGGADDALMALHAAAQLTSAVDQSRACTIGRSRGGAVALLAAARDRRIRCAVAISAPMDWFDAMWQYGAPRNALVARVIAAHAGPDRPGGQFVERIVQPVLEGRWHLSDARRAMIASSPKYVVDRLPEVLAFYGEEDTSVPRQNAEVLHAALKRRGLAAGHVWVSPFAGHDAEPLLIAREVPAFLHRKLGTPIGVRLPGADAR